MIQEIMDIQIAILEKTPSLLRELILEIPLSQHKLARIPGKWTIHEHACHLVVVDLVMQARFEKFHKDAFPEFRPYLPGAQSPALPLLEMDLEEKLSIFPENRQNLIHSIRQLRVEDWNKKAIHPEYLDYSAGHLLRHLMMHDHLHMFRIQQLWLTQDAFL